LRTLIKLFFIVVLALAGWAAWQLYVPLTPPANSSLLLRPGYSTRRIAAELKRAGVIRSELVFGLWHVLHPKPSLKAGEYRFERAASLPQVYERIARGDIYFHVVTIPEGYTMFDIAKAMEDAGLGPAANFLHIAETKTFVVPQLGIAPAKQREHAGCSRSSRNRRSGAKPWRRGIEGHRGQNPRCCAAASDNVGKEIGSRVYVCARDHQCSERD